jgi:hypothetical protein
MTKAYVYKIVRNDDKIYIGITINWEKRLKAHTKSDRFNIGIKSSDVLVECSTYEEAEELEEYYIEKFDSFNNGLNLSVNGKGNHLCDNFTTRGFKFSNKSKLLMSQSAKARGISDSCKAAAYSQDTKNKLSNIRKGICWGPLKITNEQVKEIMDAYYSDSYQFENDFILDNVAKKYKHLVGHVSLQNLVTPNGKALNKKTLCAKFFAKKFNVNKNTILGIIANDGVRAKHQTEI